VSLVGHTKSYVQVLLPGGEENKKRLMGKSAEVKIATAHRWYVTGELLEVHTRTAPRPEAPPAPKYSSQAAEAWDLKTRKRKEAQEHVAWVNAKNDEGNNTCSTCGAAEGTACGEHDAETSGETEGLRKDESLGAWARRALTTAPESRLEWILTAGVLLGLAGVMLTWMAAHLGKIAAGVSAIAHRLGDKSE
jgi:hypothetical protein